VVQMLSSDLLKQVPTPFKIDLPLAFSGSRFV
jgi:hypothetical protein